jgi:gamma-glutamylcyclotransferase (GGCT)/AIG2-like uncharacterized protein YtfP
MMKQYPVLVYGTLRPTGGNYENFLIGATTAEFTVRLDGFTMYDNGMFPYLDRGDSTITATLLFLDEEQYTDRMAVLDRLEGYAEDRTRNHYDRILHTFNVGDLTVQAWMYLASPSTMARAHQGGIEVVESGDWIAYEARYPLIPTY